MPGTDPGRARRGRVQPGPGTRPAVGPRRGRLPSLAPGSLPAESRDQLGRADAVVYLAIDGPVNLTAPEPVRGREFAQALGRQVGRRAWLAAPSPMVRMGLGVVTDILVRGKRVIPARVSAFGYQFSFPALDAAVHDLLGQPGDAAAAPR